MIEKRQFWVVSPNVVNEEKTVEDWKKEIRDGYAFMGWEPGDYAHKQMGPKFAGKAAQSIQLGDIILVARQHNGITDAVGFGVVEGKCEPRTLLANSYKVFARKLQPFKRWEIVSKGIDLSHIVNHSWALVQLHPEVNGAHRKVCDWLEKQLSPKPVAITQKDLFKSKLDYQVRRKADVTNARKVEAKLLWDYKCWLKKRGRKLIALRFDQLQCDGCEKDGRNLIEAKGSTSREDIRMAVGQLLDYVFQAKAMFNKLNLAILLPTKPDSDDVRWLAPLGISIIWHSGHSFTDNARGRFTK